MAIVVLVAWGVGEMGQNT
uniref:Uncharacterized protein n=1 Tax=Arundo donax TaxID=35708 RepID=A0A0A9B4P1_ARUDO